MLVEDTSSALELLGKAARIRGSAKIIGVTGSVGKTGVKEAIFAALDRSSRGAAHRSVRSYNNHVGVPLSLARMTARSQFGVFEMGMNHAGEIAALTAQVRPHVAVITTIAPAHIEMLGSEEAIADAKAEIFDGLEAGGTAIIPADSPHYRPAARGGRWRPVRKSCRFGRAAHADVRLLDALPQANGGSLVTADLGERRLCYTVAEPGDHWVINSLAVMAAVRAVGGDLGAAGLSLAGDGRPQGPRRAPPDCRSPGGNALLIDESYNANPASMRATLAQLGADARQPPHRGAGRDEGTGRFRAGVSCRAGRAARGGAGRFCPAGRPGNGIAWHANWGKARPAPLGKAIRFAHCGTVDEAIAALEEFGLAGGDAVLVKGSNSVGLARLVAHFVGQGSAPQGRSECFI